MILTHKVRRQIGKLSPRHRLAAALVAIPCFGVVAAFGIAPDTLVEKVAFKNVVEELALPALTPTADEEAGYAREERIQRGDTVASLLARLQIDDAEASLVLRNNAQAKALYQLIPGKAVRATATADGKLLSLRYLNGSNLISIDRAADKFVVKQEAAQLERRVLMKSAEIRNSLFGATDAAGLPDTIATQIAEIFSTDIDFHRDLRKGDRFSVVYEVFYDRGEPIKSGRVLAAEFVNQGKAYSAVYFDYAENEGGYYTVDGKNLRKQFLRSPLEFSRITSGFTTARFHPVLQTWRAHKGIDYGAPTGTRVKATADGVVDLVGRQGGYGNVVVLRHQSKFTTWYGHLSAYANGLRKGKRVAQGEVIGFVGATGMATGPHLHYEFRINDVHQNPLRVAMPAALPISPELKPKFDQTAKLYSERLGLLRTTNLARLD
ncbi:MAG TPA: peptidoglycan DD-metalloendopeptidase family protein [Burkholderiales bacterium]|nr:peptidoglycan DD-metalloendopeptidase family protein [Burkholderiales bacterium]